MRIANTRRIITLWCSRENGGDDCEDALLAECGPPPTPAWDL